MLAGVVAGLGNAALGVMSKVLTQKLFEAIVGKILIYMLRKLAASTTNTIDDAIIEDIVKRIKQIQK